MKRLPLLLLFFFQYHMISQWLNDKIRIHSLSLLSLFWKRDSTSWQNILFFSPYHIHSPKDKCGPFLSSSQYEGVLCCFLLLFLINGKSKILYLVITCHKFMFLFLETLVHALPVHIFIMENFKFHSNQTKFPIKLSLSSSVLPIILGFTIRLITCRTKDVPSYGKPPGTKWDLSTIIDVGDHIRFFKAIRQKIIF